jgi:hypothetical protein
MDIAKGPVKKVKNIGINAGRFATVKHQAKRRNFLALVAVIAFSLAACSTGAKVDPGTFLDGEWINTSEDDTYRIELDGNNWVSYDGDKPVAKGTWTASVTPDAGVEGEITFIITRVDRGKGWVYLESKYNRIKTSTVKYSIDSEGNQITLSEKKLASADPAGIWKKLEGIYAKGDGTGSGHKASASGKGTGKGSSEGSDSQAEKRSSITDGGPSIFYIITGNGTSFTATESGVTVGAVNQTITDIINTIRADANGANVAIQFGNGENVLNIGAASVSFDTSGGNWGSITLSGRITSSASPAIGAYMVSITSTADISTTSGGGSAIINSGTFIVNDGTVLANGANSYGIRNRGGTVIVNKGHISPRGEGIYNESDSGRGGNVAITGGTVYSMSGKAIYNNSGCTVLITGGTLYSSSSETIYNPGGTVTITGGTVSGSHSGHAIWNADGMLIITGGTVSTTNNNRSYAAIGNDGGAVTITGGSVIVPGGGNAVINAGGTVTITSPPAVIVGNQITIPR